MKTLALQPLSKPFDVTLAPPGSKSLTNRALVVAALANGRCTLRNVLFADDTQVMIESLRRLGFELEIDEQARQVTVNGRAGAIPSDRAELMCGNSGTTIRFLAALCTLGRGEYRLDGVERMRQRPIGELVDLLRNLAARVQYEGAEGYPPVRVLADGLAGGRVRFGAAQSSQYLSAVLMAAPYARHEVRVDLDPEQTSWPYIAMTMRLMTDFGVFVELERDRDTGQPRRIVVPGDRYHATDYTIEPDASAATYWLAAAAIHPGAKVTIPGLGRKSLQGDVAFADVLHQMGADLVFGDDFITLIGTDRLEGIDVDLSAMPDTAQTLAAIAVFADGPSTLRGLRTLRVKETDRLAALQNELTRLGATARIDGDTLHITPPAAVKPAQIATYDDHRMAMSFAVVGTRASGIVIEDPQCVNKTYPQFFEDLEKLRA